MSLWIAIASCLCGADYSIEEERKISNNAQTASRIVDALYASEKNTKEFRHSLRHSIHDSSWSENLAEAILDALKAALKGARAMSPAMKDAYDRTLEAASVVGGFAKEHPEFCTVIALGILVILMPWVIELLGFAAEGPIEGTTAFSQVKRPANKDLEAHLLHCGNPDMPDTCRKAHYFPFSKNSA